MSAPTWYDVLDVAPDASADEVRTAWRTEIADLEPGDRRFDALNRAAKVLLDPAARAEYDAGLAAEAPGPVTGLRPSLTSGAGGADPSLVEVGADPSLVEEGALAPVTRPRSPGRGRGVAVPTWLLLGLAVVATALVAATAWVWTGSSAAQDEAAREAQTAAERAVVPVLSFDHEDLEGSQQRAQALLTGSYREDYDKLFAVIAENAPSTRTTVEVEVVASGIVRATDDRVQVLVFVDRPTTNKASTEPVVYRDQVTLSMQRVDDEWLVDDMTTSPASG